MKFELTYWFKLNQQKGVCCPSLIDYKWKTWNYLVTCGAAFVLSYRLIFIMVNPKHISNSNCWLSKWIECPYSENLWHVCVPKSVDRIRLNYLFDMYKHDERRPFILCKMFYFYQRDIQQAFFVMNFFYNELWLPRKFMIENGNCSAFGLNSAHRFMLLSI